VVRARPEDRREGPSPWREAAGEAGGTFVLVLVGTGTVASSVCLGAPAALPAVAAVWGLGVAAAVLLAGPHSGAHLNPAVSLALALLRPDRFPPRSLGRYVAAQCGGAALAGAAVLALFGPSLRAFEEREGILRGTAGSERSAMAFGEYFPNPALHGTGPAAEAVIGPAAAVLAEAAGTAVLVFVAFAASDPAGVLAGRPRAAAAAVGATVAALVVVLAPWTQAGLNPARDLGPRVVAAFAGWGEVALPGPRGGFWVYLAGPLAGGALGGLAYERWLRRRGAGA